MAAGGQAVYNKNWGIPYYPSFITLVSGPDGNRESLDQEGEMADEIKLEIWADYT